MKRKPFYLKPYYIHTQQKAKLEQKKKKEKPKEEKKQEEPKKEEKKQEQKPSSGFHDEYEGLRAKLYFKSGKILLGKIVEVRKFEMKVDLGNNQIIYVFKHGLEYIQPLDQPST